MKLVIDNFKFESVRLDNAAADDIYTNGRESSSIEHIMQKKDFYGGKKLPTVVDKGL